MPKVPARGVTIDELKAIARIFGIKLRLGLGKPKRKCVLVLNNTDYSGLHAVYFDGVRVLDPWPYNYNTTEANLKKSVYYLY